jgi:hypothetical protein
LSYYFISGNTFTTHGGVSAPARWIGCVNQMPVGLSMSAPVHLPQNSESSPSPVHLQQRADHHDQHRLLHRQRWEGNGQSTLSANSQPNVVGYRAEQQHVELSTTINNQSNNFSIEWHKAWPGLPTRRY